MSEITTRLDDTRGEPTRHLSATALEARLRALRPAPKDAGRLTHIVRRPSKDAREVLPRARLSPEVGLPGDNWNHKPSPDPTAQLTVMQTGVAELIANGQSLALFGDNLFVDLDLSVANLPVGSRLRVGGAVVEVTPMPHDGCSKFNARFGNDALRFVNTKPTRHLSTAELEARLHALPTLNLSTPNFPPPTPPCGSHDCSPGRRLGNCAPPPTVHR